MSICSPTLVGCQALPPPDAAMPAAACACADAAAEDTAADMPDALPPRSEAPFAGLMATGDGAPDEDWLAEGWGDMASGCWLRWGAEAMLS
jgi:hypothetical protein